MSEQSASYRRILKSSSIIGGASVINILVGLVRTKALAMLLGPAGIGLVSLYAGLMSTASAVAAMGISVTGTRQVAQALGEDDAQALAVVRRAMLWGTLLLAGAGALLVWSLRELLAVRVLGDARHAGAVGWLSLGVGLSVLAAAQGALLQGMRRMGDMARLSVFGAVLNTLAGVALLWQWGQAGLATYVVMGPLLSCLLGYWYVSRLPRPAAGPMALQALLGQWQTLLRLGVPFMGAGLVAALVQLWMRVTVGSSLGAEALGHFQAASTVSMQYIGFVLAAMGADYYPRLTGLIRDPQAATGLVNQQTEIALLLSAPIFIALVGLAPWVMVLLYSADFAPSVAVLRWQILGDVLKVASWPLGFVILATGAGRVFFLTETLALLLMGGLVAAFVASAGLQVTGMAFLVSYVVYLPLVYALARRSIGFRWSPENLRLMLVVFVACVAAAVASALYWWGALAAVVLSLAFLLHAFGRLAHASQSGGPVGRLAALAQRLTFKWGIKHE